MGGYGSGRWYRSGTKETVEDCRTIDINWLIREGIFDAGWRRGSINWTDCFTGEERSSISYEVNLSARWMRLSYRFTGEDVSFDYKVPLVTTELPWGGVRWWFVCALTCNGRYCGRRVGKLHLPPQGRYYGCRHCYNLTYTSCQESHKYDRMWRSLAAECRTDAATAMLLWEGDVNEDHRIERAVKRREQLRRRRQLRQQR